MDKYCVLTIHISEVTYLMTAHPPSGSTQLINQPPDIRHCDKHRQTQFSRQFFAEHICLLALRPSNMGELAMRAALVALMLMIGSQARAECSKLCYFFGG